MPDSDNDSTRPYSRPHTPAHGMDPSACIQDRPLRDMNRELREIRERLNAGDTCMTRLECTLENLTSAVKETMLTTKELTKALQEMSGKTSPVWQKVTDSLITWAVPVAAVVILWALVQSGVVAALPKVGP